ncbi:MAG TPA: hypothetical protein VM434_04545 [Beijerinckiaceae bacterium]|nr:hypothetical protein [Beijerinckiaceae bacterium]
MGKRLYADETIATVMRLEAEGRSYMAIGREVGLHPEKVKTIIRRQKERALIAGEAGATPFQARPPGRQPIYPAEIVNTVLDMWFAKKPASDIVEVTGLSYKTVQDLVDRARGRHDPRAISAEERKSRAATPERMDAPLRCPEFGIEAVRREGAVSLPRVKALEGGAS